MRESCNHTNEKLCPSCMQRNYELAMYEELRAEVKRLKVQLNLILDRALEAETKAERLEQDLMIIASGKLLDPNRYAKQVLKEIGG